MVTGYFQNLEKCGRLFRAERCRAPSQARTSDPTSFQRGPADRELPQFAACGGTEADWINFNAVVMATRCGLGQTAVRKNERWTAPYVLLAAFGLALLLLITGCATSSRSSLQRHTFSSPHMGTLFSITLYASDPATAKQAATAAFARVAQLDRIMTDYNPQSELMQLCRRPAGVPVRVSPELFEVLQRALQVSGISEGAFDVTVGPYVHLWRTARKSRILPSPEEIAAARQVIGFEKVRLDPRSQTVTLAVSGMKLDLGGIGKGFAADAGLKVLRGLGIRRALVAASGDLAIGDPPPGRAGWTVAISSIGAGESAPAKTLLLHNAGVSTSGDAEQFVDIGGIRYSHIVDPRTGIGLTDRVQATVIARDGTTSDALAKVVCVLGAARGMAAVETVPGAAALILRPVAGGQQMIPSKRFTQLKTQP